MERLGAPRGATRGAQTGSIDHGNRDIFGLRASCGILTTHRLRQLVNKLTKPSDSTTSKLLKDSVDSNI